MTDSPSLEAGFIGSEIAATLAINNKRVVMVLPEAVNASRILTHLRRDSPIEN